MKQRIRNILMESPFFKQLPLYEQKGLVQALQDSHGHRLEKKGEMACISDDAPKA